MNYLLILSSIILATLQAGTMPQAFRTPILCMMLLRRERDRKLTAGLGLTVKRL